MISDKQTVSFGDLCREIKLTTKNPIADGYERYIGLEHLDSGSLKITRWGEIAEDNPGFTRVFKKGHVLFGKRRPYLKKAAVAEFDGICSGDIIVLESTARLAYPDILQVIVQSQGFWNYAVSNSSGSLSPRTKFKLLANYKLELGDELWQKNKLSVFYAFQSAKFCAAAAQSYFQVLFTSLLKEKLVLKAEGNEKSLEDVCTIVRGSSPRPKGDARYYGGSIPRLMVEDIVRDGKYVSPCIDYLTKEGAQKSRLKEEGTLVIVCSGTPGTVGRPAILNFPACIHDGIISLDKIDEAVVRRDYLYYLLLLNQRQIYNLATHGGTFVNLTTSIVKKMRFVFPALEYQDSLVSVLECFERQVGLLSLRSDNIGDLEMLMGSL